MLVLSRHRDESVIITDTNGVRIRMTIVDIRGDKVRIGVDAPTSVVIHREEVQDAVDRERAGR